MKKTPKKPRNPNDATFRNIRALKKRVAELEASVSQLQEQMARILPSL